MTFCAASRIWATSSGWAARTVFFSPATAADVWICPNAPNSTLVKLRFIALHMMMVRMNPLAPSSAPAMISSLLLSTKPIMLADNPA